MGQSIACLECGLPTVLEARGLCSRCYQLLRNHGEIDRYPTVLKTLDEWIALIDTSDPDACWPWPGPMNTNGYGNAGGPAHRAVYERMVGPIPKGQQIDHACHNESGCSGGTTCPHRRCVNWVKHLEPTTAGENLLRSPNTFNAINAARTHCPQGHEYSSANTTHRNGRRHCKQCDRNSSRAYYYANLEKVRAAAREYQRQKRVKP